MLSASLPAAGNVCLTLRAIKSASRSQTKLLNTSRCCIPSAIGMATKALLDESDFQTMGQDMARYDELRESVIKQSRDVGKLAKQAIFSLHRSDFKGASDKLEKAEKFAAAIRDDILAEEPNLRHGSFSAAMEEVKFFNTLTAAQSQTCAL
mmetsp:Transcript_15496/g.46791  ORF Transcript_15496/g.46791 Transcript_15496/m.46791 type:complete len:151 (-) Transcript_15496:121-573(-)